MTGIVRRSIVALVSLTFIGGAPKFCAAQDSGRFVRWAYQDVYHLFREHTPTLALLGVGGAGFVALSAQVDEEGLDEVQKVFSGDELYLDVTNELGTPLVLGAPIAAFAVGLASGNHRLSDAAYTTAESILYSSFITLMLKNVVGRSRPEEREGAKQFHPFSGNTSMPSGHATIAFALLTPWVYYYPHPAAYGLFVLGLGTAVSRVALDRHWPSDVIIGGGIGFLMATYLSKRHLSEARHGSAFHVTPLLSPSVAGVHVAVSLDGLKTGP